MAALKSLKTTMDDRPEGVRVRYPDRTAYVQALDYRDRIFGDHNRTSISANRLFKKIYQERATTRRNARQELIPSRLEIKERQRWVQLTPYLLSHGRRQIQCRRGAACRPTRRVPEYGPMTVREMLRVGFGPFQSEGALKTEVLRRLRLLLRMSYMKDAYRERMRVFWEKARFKLDGAGQQLDFHEQYGDISEGRFQVLLRDIDGATGADYKDPTAADLEAFRLDEPDEGFDADDIPPEPDRRVLVEDLEDQKSEDPEEDDEGMDDVIAAPITYGPDGTYRTTKPQVLRQNNVVVTRLPTSEEKALGRQSSGMLGRVSKDGKFTNERARRPRLASDPDYVHFKGKWVLSPLNYPRNTPDNAPWGFMDPELRGTVESVKQLKDRPAFVSLLGENFPKGVHVSLWDKALAVLEGGGCDPDDMRLYTPWGGVLTPLDTDEDVEVPGDADDAARKVVRWDEERKEQARPQRLTRSGRTFGLDD